MNRKLSKLSYFLALIVTLALLFQVGHFLEHLAQFSVWIFGPKDSMFMSSWAISLVEWLASFFTNADPLQAKRIGVELLHFIGNFIFLIGISAYFYFNKSKSVKIAFWVQLIHVLEHTLLTVSILTVGVPLGISTLFGLQTSVRFFIGYRIIWHFIINLIPSFYIVKAFLEQKRAGRILQSIRNKVQK